MRQQINLYQPIFSEARKPLSGALVGVCLTLVVAGLVGYTIYAHSQLDELTAAVDQLRSEQSAQEAALNAAGEENAARDKPAIVQARVQRLEGMIAERRSALQVLQSGAAGQTTGFAARMEALARRHVEGLWIDKLVLSGTNGSMSLGGGTLDADTVPVYLHSLAQESVLSGTRFDEFFIERPKLDSETPSGATSDENSGESPKAAKAASLPAHVRFRAGSKALAPAPEPST